ncbi:hypothetical protein Cfla_0195 [Cellulomonas flavigena DSM 20109]|uniref:Uncharacterized protein n=1 Tax=Cellulomonas flavigena (strain ATCC 482 / DSM 20109 / BCRC 11376 / JCM 18109 / NBRC 3775 / NCIMB 8073 / NRS 134) TaxID=446466 RepID=D5UGD1_CELFN|nr:hypothetical protein [Cellulomonas flavigena]ADG73114.1 hypothetical protein Cfla_0195 [Cellulomonas flavigena DSM 20109]
MNDDLVRRLRAADPAARLHLRADDAMREAIMTTDVTTDRAAQVARGRRLRRGLVSGGLATVLVGGGVAYAGVVNDWYRGGGAHDGLTCLTQWGGPEDERSGGPVLSGDLVADCRRYQEETGLAAIEDAVAFRHQGVLYVAPRGEVPADATLVAAGPDDLALQELESSLMDWVDGLGSLCLDESAAVAAARAELDRLGLDDWSVRTQASVPVGAGQEPDPGAGSCADITYAYDTADEEVVDPGLPDPVAEPADAPVPSAHPESVPSGARPKTPASTTSASAAPAPSPTAGDLEWPYGQVPRTLAVLPHSRAPRDSLREHSVPFVYDLRDLLRERVADACVELDEAERIVTEAIGDEHHWPTVVIEDGEVQCTRVDLAVGGSIQVSLRGPRG